MVALPRAKAQILDTLKRVLAAGEPIPDAALDILADVLIDTVVQEYADTAFRSDFSGESKAQKGRDYHRE